MRFRNIFIDVNANRDIVSFPFPPHLCRWLFVKIKGQIIERETDRLKALDIDLHSIDGRIIRLLLERVDYPGIKDVKQGFRFYVSVPRKANEHRSIMHDGQRGQLQMPPEAVKILTDHYEDLFRAHYHSFVCGYIQGNQGKRRSVRQATEIFMRTYDLDGVYSYDQLIKYYKRTDSPVKISIYAKKNTSVLLDGQKKECKSLLDRRVKK